VQVFFKYALNVFEIQYTKNISNAPFKILYSKYYESLHTGNIRIMRMMTKKKKRRGIDITFSYR